MFMSAAADMPWCFGFATESSRRLLPNLVRLARRTLQSSIQKGPGC